MRWFAGRLRQELGDAVDHDMRERSSRNPSEPAKSQDFADIPQGVQEAGPAGWAHCPLRVSVFQEAAVVVGMITRPFCEHDGGARDGAPRTSVLIGVTDGAGKASTVRRKPGMNLPLPFDAIPGPDIHLSLQVSSHWTGWLGMRIKEICCSKFGDTSQWILFMQPS